MLVPTYAYRCADCSHAFDIYQQFSDDALTRCPECDGKLRKVFGSLGVTFSGSGFYRTDSRNEISKSGSSGSTDSSTPTPAPAPTSSVTSGAGD